MGLVCTQTGLGEILVIRDHHRINLQMTLGLVGVQIGLSETSVMRDYHKDAIDRYNVTCDFPKVIRELVDPNKRFPFQASPAVQPTPCLVCTLHAAPALHS